MPKKSSLATFHNEVAATRSAMLSGVRDLPAPLGQLAFDAIAGRIRRGHGRPMLGEIAPWLIADLLGLRPSSAVRRIALAWLHVYFFVMMLDDAIDRGLSCVGHENLIVGSVLLQRGLVGLSLNGQMRHVADAAWVETALAGIREIKAIQGRVGGMSQYAPADAGQKLALLKICSAALRSQLPRSASHGIAVDEVIEHIAVGIQILDDVTDIDEDLRDGRVSYPLAQIGRSQRKRRRLMAGTGEDALWDLMESGCLEKCLNEVADSLEQALDRARALHASDSRAFQFLSSVLANTREASRAVQATRIRATLGAPVESGRETNRGWARKKHVIGELRRALAVVAQTT